MKIKHLSNEELRARLKLLREEEKRVQEKVDYDDLKCPYFQRRSEIRSEIVKIKHCLKTRRDNENKNR